EGHRPAEPNEPDSESDGSKVPAEVRRKTFWKAHSAHYQRLLDETVPDLQGLTPRAAAQNPKMRPALVQWLKGHLHHLDTLNRRDGLDLNIDWVLDELGVPELKM